MLLRRLRTSVRSLVPQVRRFSCAAVQKDPHSRPEWKLPNNRDDLLKRSGVSQIPRIYPHATGFPVVLPEPSNERTHTVAPGVWYEIDPDSGRILRSDLANSTTEIVWLRRDDGFETCIPRYAYYGINDKGLLLIDSYLFEARKSQWPHYIETSARIRRQSKAPPLLSREKVPTPEFAHWPEDIFSRFRSSKTSLTYADCLQFAECPRSHFHARLDSVPDEITVEKAIGAIVEQTVASVLTADFSSLVEPFHVNYWTCKAAWERMRVDYHTQPRRAETWPYPAYADAWSATDFAAKALMGVLEEDRFRYDYPSAQSILDSKSKQPSTFVPLNDAESQLGEIVPIVFGWDSQANKRTGYIRPVLFVHGTPGRALRYEPDVREVRHAAYIAELMTRTLGADATPDEVVLLYCDSKEMLSVRPSPELRSSVFSECTAISKDFAKCEDAFDKYPPNDLEQRIVMSFSTGKRPEHMDEDDTCAKCAFRPWCLPFHRRLERAEVGDLVIGDNKWFRGNVQKIISTCHGWDDSSSTVLAVQPIDPAEQTVRVRAHGPAAYLLNQLDEGDSVLLPRAHIEYDVNTHELAAVVSDPFSIVASKLPKDPLRKTKANTMVPASVDEVIALQEDHTRHLKRRTKHAIVHSGQTAEEAIKASEVLDVDSLRFMDP